MRAFHFSWWGFFIAFFIWFAIAPLLPLIKDSLDLQPSDIWTSNICAVLFDICMRFVFGAVCDKFGARIPMGCVLMFASIPTACIGLVNSLTGLIVVRLFIGVAGSTFVMCQCWSTRMFTKEIVGIANGLVGGWGNVGGGATQIVMGTLLFPLFTKMWDGDEEKAWRTVTIVPAVVAFTTGMIIIKFGQDCPKGNYKDLKKSGEMAEVSATASFRQGALDLNTWILFIHYACCFGVELTVNNAAVSFFVQYFDLDIGKASAIASIFGFMNLFARGVGGWLSDKSMPKMGMRGRILVQAFLLIAEGVCIFIFAAQKSLAMSIVMLTIFSIFVQAAEGSTYGIVPYVNRQAPGAVAGIVGAGGPAGAVCFGLIFRQIEDQRRAFWIMACAVCGAGVLSVLITIKGHRGLLCGKDEDSIAKLNMPVEDDEEAEKPKV
uniref:Nitrate/nitrite transporter n=2 Tax=Corethron hystrix TaxID=216773 RepID=A0A6U5LT52_9STRA|mmetsp:Transcript_6992/g.15129  ORF Transcript_6992/g.15129 Transcript_6992/m.15129 type:complete len:434 (+) Transcript_6992:237-1538(+)